jgi:hypothetical protein
MAETLLVGRALNSIVDRRNSDAMNVALNIGLLTPNKNTFNLPKLGFKGERRIEKGTQRFRLYDIKTKKILFLMELIPESSPKIVEFKRGGWEHLLEKYVREHGKTGSEKESKSTLKLGHRPKQRKDRA